MDAKQLGTFIAERRKQLGLTQALLSEKIHVTDKAVSRWERGIGLPEINSIEALADALDLSLTELMQAKFHEIKALITKKQKNCWQIPFSYQKQLKNLQERPGAEFFPFLQ